MLLLNTVKLVLIALNIIPNRIRHKKIMFFIYMGTLVTHGKSLTCCCCHPGIRQTAIAVVVLAAAVIYEK